MTSSAAATRFTSVSSLAIGLSGRFLQSSGAGDLDRDSRPTLPAPATEFQYFDPVLLRLVIANAIKAPDASPELIWLAVGSEWAMSKRSPPNPIPDSDLLRAVIGIVQRGMRGSDLEILQAAMRAPLFVEPTLLNSIIKYAQRLSPPMKPKELWAAAWAERVALGTPLPTPPDLELFDTIIFAARFGGTPNDILTTAHSLLKPPNPDAPINWPPYIATELLKWVVFFAITPPEASDADVKRAALYMVKYSGAPYPPVPEPQFALLRAIINAARTMFLLLGPSGTEPRDVLAQALADELAQQLLTGRVGYDVEPELLQEIIRATEDLAELRRGTANADQIPMNFSSMVWERALAARAAYGLWPPIPVPDRTLLNAIVLSALLLPRADQVIDIGVREQILRNAPNWPSASELSSLQWAAIATTVRSTFHALRRTPNRSPTTRRPLR